MQPYLADIQYTTAWWLPNDCLNEWLDNSKMIALHDNCLLLDGVKSSGISFRKQKLGKNFHFEKQEIINFSNNSKPPKWRASEELWHLANQNLKIYLFFTFKM